MDESFADLPKNPVPGRPELILFVSKVEAFLQAVLYDKEQFGFLWEEGPDLRQEAIATFETDCRRSAVELRKVIDSDQISDDDLERHGLQGAPLRFKFRVLDAISRRWRWLRDRLSLPEWLKQILDAIDAILDSLIDCAGGIGALLKEFKDALSALIKTTRAP